MLMNPFLRRISPLKSKLGAKTSQLEDGCDLQSRHGIPSPCSPSHDLARELSFDRQVDPPQIAHMADYLASPAAQLRAVG